MGVPQVSDIGKLLGLASITIGLFALIWSNRITLEDADAYLTLILGYLVGGGEVAVRKHAPSTVVVPNVNEHEIATTSGTQPAQITVTTEAENINGQ